MCMFFFFSSSRSLVHFTQNKKLVKVGQSRTWSLGQIGHKWSSDQLRITRAISHLSNLFIIFPMKISPIKILVK